MSARYGRSVGRKDQRNGYYSFEEGAIISRPYHDCLVGAGRMDVLQEVGHQAIKDGVESRGRMEVRT